jgi:outer membrane protein
MTRSLSFLLLAFSAVALRAETLTLADARAEAIRVHPRITVAELQARSAHEEVIAARAGYLPTLALNATGVDTGEQVTRVAAGSLSNSQLYDRVGVGATISQTITDFGRTGNLTASAKERSAAAKENVIATRAQIILAVDRAYFSALAASAIEKVAEQTLSTRKLFYQRTESLANNRLRSELDVRFAQVSVGEAKLLADDAANNLHGALASLASLLGRHTLNGVTLAPAPSFNLNLPTEAEPLIAEALDHRPEILAQRSLVKADRDLARAARDQRLPTIAAVGAVGVVPEGSAQHFEHDYAAVGVNVNLPLFTGGLYYAREKEAELREAATEASLRDLENNVIRDVQLAWFAAQHAHERLSLTASLLENANAAHQLAQSRFDQGLSSIIELNQAEIAQTNAQIAHASAEFDYRISREFLAYQVGEPL